MERARLKDILLGRAWGSRPEILEVAGMLLVGLLEVCEAASSDVEEEEEGAPGTIKETEDC